MLIPKNSNTSATEESPQLWKSTIKATNCVSTSSDMLFPDPLSPTPSASSAMKTPDQQSRGPSESLL